MKAIQYILVNSKTILLIIFFLIGYLPTKITSKKGFLILRQFLSVLFSFSKYKEVLLHIEIEKEKLKESNSYQQCLIEKRITADKLNKKSPAVTYKANRHRLKAQKGNNKEIEIAEGILKLAKKLGYESK